MDPRLIQLWERCRALFPEGDDKAAPATQSEILDAILTRLEAHAQALDPNAPSPLHLQHFFQSCREGIFFMMLDEPIDWQNAPDKDALLEWVLDHQRMTHANPAMLAQYGASADDFLGLTPRRLFAHDLEQGRAAWRELLDEGILQTRTHEERLNGAKFWVEGVYQLLFDRAGRVVGHFGTQRDVSDEVAIVDALRRSEARLDEAQRIAHLGYWDWNILNNDLFWSPGIYRQLGLEVQSGPANYEDFVEATHPDDRKPVGAAVQAALEGAPYSIQHRIVRPDGVISWVHERGEVEFDATGKPVRMLGTAIDITEQKNAEFEMKHSLHEKEVLLQEIHHRVKNNLQVIKSLLQLQRSKLTDPQMETVFQESTNRIQVMALLHERLYQSESLASIDVPAYVESITESLLRSYDAEQRGIDVSVEFAELGLDVDRAIPLGLLLNEIVSNSLKHAFCGRSTGHIWIVGRSEGETGFLVEVRDDGVGLPEGAVAEKATTLGLKLIQNLSRQLGAELAIECVEGTRYRLRFASLQ